MIKLFSNKISHLNKKVKYLQTQFSYLHIMTNFGHENILILTFIFTMCRICNIFSNIIKINMKNEMYLCEIFLIMYKKEKCVCKDLTFLLNKKVKYLQTQFSYLHIMTNFGHEYILILTFIFTMYTLQILLTLHTAPST
jgi:hypothetical protein